MNLDRLKQRLKNTKTTTWLVTVFVVLFLLAIYNVAAAEDMTLRGGTTVFNVNDGVVVMLDTRFDVGPGDARTAIGLFRVSESRYRDRRDVPTQAGAYAMLVDRLGPVEFGLGIAYQQEDEIVVNTPWRFALTIAWRFDNHWLLAPDAARLFHMSTAGSSPINSGWDLLLFDWTIR